MKIRDLSEARGDAPAASSALPVVGQLLARRAEILGWLSRLDAEGGSESPRVVDRIRADYQQRLHRVVQELTEHVASIRAELADARERLQHAEARFVEAEDSLHEARLRHRIGELAAEEWQGRSGALEQAVDSAAGARSQAEEEVQRYEEVLSQVDSGTESARVTRREPEEIASREEERPALDASRRPVEPPAAQAPRPEADVGSGAETPAAAAVPDDPDFAFLERLDRAIATSALPAEAVQEGEDADETGEATRPQKGAKCPECGYTNDFEAWYCGVCGVDLA